MRRFFIAGELSEAITITGSDAYHIGHVLRCRVGDEIVIADAAGRSARFRLAKFSADSVKAELLEYLNDDTEASIDVTLLQCLPKGDKMELIVQKAAELGAAMVLPTASRNCVVKYDGAKRQARCLKWQKIADEAAKQCGRTRRPEVLPVMDFKEMLTALPPQAVKLMCYEAPGQLPLKQVLRSSQSREYAVLIGPEGGFTAEEAELCRAAGFQVCGIGARILRTETAALAALSMIMYEKGDLGGI